MVEILSVLGGAKDVANAVDVKPLNTTTSQGNNAALYVVFAILFLLIIALIFMSINKR